MTARIHCFDVTIIYILYTFYLYFYILVFYILLYLCLFHTQRHSFLSIIDVNLLVHFLYEQMWEEIRWPTCRPSVQTPAPRREDRPCKWTVLPLLNDCCHTLDQTEQNRRTQLVYNQNKQWHKSLLFSLGQAYILPGTKSTFWVLIKLSNLMTGKRE